MRFEDFLIGMNEEGENKEWTSQDLIEIIELMELDDLLNITEIVLDYIGEEDADDLEDLDEKMSSQAKLAAKKIRMSSAFKKAQALKKRCMKINGDKVRKSNGRLICGTDGKVKKGMSKQAKKELRKTRFRNRSTITY